MIVLGIDTAGAACSLAVARFAANGDDAGAPVRRITALRHGHGEVLIDLLDSLLSDAGCRPGDVDLIGVTTGPGGFTGLRLGLAAAAGLALAGGAGIVGVPSFDVLTAMVTDQPDLASGGALLLAIDSRRAEPFVRLPGGSPSAGTHGPRERHVAMGDLPDLLPPGPVAVAGDAADDVVTALTGVGRRAWSANPAGPAPAAGTLDPLWVARLAYRRRAGAAPYPPAPLYLRPPDAKRLGANTGANT